MSYLEEFKNQINNRDFHKFFQLWEEYCTADEVIPEEFIELLLMIKKSDFAPLFGKFAETALPLWQCIMDEESSYNVLRLLIDLETTNTPLLAETAYHALEKKFGSDPQFKERLRQVGMRSRESFQGAITNFELLAHLKKGNFVFHTGGWGTGEVMEVSPIREQAAIEFENVTGIKHMTFDNAFKTLIPLTRDNFLARRFADPDSFEEIAKKNPVETIKILLRDLGPKTAAEIKDELCELVIPENDWGKWWQGVRSKLKKDTMIDTPLTLRDPFKLRKNEYSHVDRLHQEIEQESNVSAIIQTSYSFARDLPQTFRKREVKESLKEKLLKVLIEQELTPQQEFQIILFLESMFGHQVEGRNIKDFIQSVERIDQVISEIDIVAFKKKALVMVREHREDWAEIFANFLFNIQPNTLKDYILNELNHENTKELLLKNLRTLMQHPERYPETFLWYFQKAAKKKANVPFADKEGQCKLLETFLILLHKIELEAKYRDLVKKMYNILVAKRFAVLRALIEGTTIEFIKEFLLLVSKCHTFADHEKKIIHSLAQVVHPTLAPEKKSRGHEYDPDVLWTTQEGYLKTQERVKTIATVEMIENAREVEAARALGDLRENAEYKFACERRSRLQNEMKVLSKQLNKARIITEMDITPNEVGIGNVVDLETSTGNKISYTILGPWEADPDDNVISYKSQFAQALNGLKAGEQLHFRGEDYKILGVKSFLE